MRVYPKVYHGARAVHRQQYSQAVALLSPLVSPERNANVAMGCYYLGLAWRGLHQPTVAAGLFARALEGALSSGKARFAARCRSQLIWELLAQRQIEAARALLHESAHYTASNPGDWQASLRHENGLARHDLLTGDLVSAATRAIEVAARAQPPDRLLALETILLAAEGMAEGA